MPWTGDILVLLHGFREAQGHWEAHAARDTQGGLKEPRTVRWLDYRRKLAKQRPDVRYKVLYPRSATNLVSAVVDTQVLPQDDGVNAGMAFNGFAADFECYWFGSNNRTEGHYLSAVLNSALINAPLKLLQTRGLWGERDIVKRVWRFRIPRFESQNPTHHELTQVSQACHDKVSQVALDIAQRYRSPARKRAVVRELLTSELAEIDGLVREILGVG
jgi:hypothetical protein